MRGWRGSLLLFVGLTLASACIRPTESAVSGVVLGPHEAVQGAVVRVLARNIAATTDSQGRFTLTGVPSSERVALTAWAPGYFISGLRSVKPGATDARLELQPYEEADHPGYEWVSAFADGGEEANCQNCHAGSPVNGLPFDGWLADAHSQATANARFFSMYSGTDLQGNTSPPTRYAYNRDYGSFPLAPDLSRPYFGPGYKLDFPETAGNCAACHAPAASVDQPYGVDPREVAGVGAEGVACDFCHKVAEVILDPDSGLPRPNMPGVLSFQLRRPGEGHQFFAGPYHDVAAVPPEQDCQGLCAVCHFQQIQAMWPYATEDTYAPVQAESRFCAPCHFGVFWDTVVYNSYGEWLTSPYSDPETGRTCQDCHMPPGQAHLFAVAEKGGQVREAETIYSHRMPGASDANLLAEALSMDVAAAREGGELKVTITLTNDGTGHDVPTDSPLRQVILLVEASDGEGDSLPLIDGSVVPEWGGIGDPEEGYYAGRPGKGYAKILMEVWTGISPSGAYWNPTRVVSDNRLGALESDASEYRFAIPQEARGPQITVRATLLLRRAFKELMDQKGWESPDMLMAEESLQLPFEPPADG
jgi:hypothetical protein